MRFLSTATCLLAGTTVASSLSIPQHLDSLDRRAAEPVLISVEDARLFDRRNDEIYTYLEKRRGGGGGGKGGGGGSSGGAKGGSGSSGSSGRGGSSSSSSLSPTYGGGKYYSGGATTAYTAGTHSPLGIAPYFIGGAALGFFPGLWLYGAYAYPYTHPYTFHNSSAPAGQQNETLPVECLCEEYQACGCDDSGNSTFVDGLVGNGTGLDPTLATVTTVNGTKTLVINGTLPNGTDASASAAYGSQRALLENSGFWLMAAVVGLTVWAL